MDTRHEAFLARANALGEADRTQRWLGTVSLWTLIIATFPILLVSTPAAAMATFIGAMLGRAAVLRVWARRKMREIDERYPKPEPRTRP